MPRRPLASLLVLIAVIGLGLYWLVRSIGTRDAQTSAPPAPAAVATEAPAPAGPLDAKSPEIETAAAIPAREQAPAVPASATPSDARWIEGRVIFPDGTPSDEHAEVVAFDQGSDEDDGPIAPVAADGTFRIGVPKDEESVSLDLRARFVFLKAPVEVRGSTHDGVLLTAKLGGCIRGKLILPLNALDRRAAIVGTSVQADAEPDNSRGDSGESARRRARVGDDLSFELGGLPPTWRIWIYAQPAGMLDLTDDAARVQPGLVVTRDFELSLGARVTGRVVDEQGAAVEEAVLAMHGEKGPSSWSNDRGEKTSADGTFELSGLRPGKLTLEAKKPGYAATSLAVGELKDGEVRDGLKIVLGRGLSISGRVQWPDGRPAADCPIAAEFTRQLGHAYSRRSDKVGCRSAPDGSFLIQGLGPESVVIDARAGDARDAESEDEDAPEAKKAVAAGPRGSAHVEGVQPGTAGLVLTLEPERVLRGRALDDTGQPITDVRVGAEPIDGSQPWERGRKAVRGASSNKDGTFELGGLHDGAWDVTAESKGHSKSAAHRVVLPADHEPFDLVLPRVASVAGTVIDPAGAPVEGAIVRWQSPEEQRGFVWRDRRDEGAHSDAQGRFVLAEVAPGPERVTASAEGFGDSEPLALELQPGQPVGPVALSLRRPGRIVGEVLDDEGHGQADRTVNGHNRSSNTSRTTSTDASGHFELEALTPGQYTIFSQPSQKQMAEDGNWERSQKQANATVKEGETVHVVLGGTPRNGVRVHGKVTCGERPVANGSIYLYPLDKRDGRTERGGTDAQGRYELTVEGPGKYSVGLNDSTSGISFTEQLAIPAEASFEHDIAFPAGRVSGRVIGIDGQPAVGVYVLLQPEARTAELSSSASYGNHETDEKGAFVFEGLKAATYRLQAGERPWENTATKSGTATRTGLVLGEGAHLDGLEIRLQAVARIEGSVTGPDGQAVAGAQMLVRDDQGNVIERWPPSMTDASGRFSIDGLTPGQATVTARTQKLVSPESQTLTLRAGETSRVELAARPGTILRVIVQESDGTPVGASLSVIDDRGRDVGRGYNVGLDVGGDSTSAPGQRVGPILPGRYKVTARNHGGASVSQDVGVSGDEQVVTLKYGG